jgi:methylenetetrahydrofolate reductase (NADPH)
MAMIDLSSQPTSGATKFAHTERRAAVDLIASGSLEIGAHRPEDAKAAAEMLPAGTPVYVNHLPRHALADTLRGLIAVREAGLEPVPHMAARRITSAAEAQAFLAAATKQAGVRKVMLIGGDTAEAAGPYNDAASVLATGMLRDHGIREVGIAAYPESHPRIPMATLNAAFAEKLALLDAQGLGAFAVTQFTFQPSRTIELATALARRYPDLPVYAGLPGPTSVKTLIGYAQRCGVGASFRALQTLGRGTIGLVANTDPSEQLQRVAHHVATGATPNIVGVHLFTFGGVDSTAAFMNRWLSAKPERD